MAAHRRRPAAAAWPVKATPIPPPATSAAETVRTSRREIVESLPTYDCILPSGYRPGAAIARKVGRTRPPESGNCRIIVPRATTKDPEYTALAAASRELSRWISEWPIFNLRRPKGPPDIICGNAPGRVRHLPTANACLPRKRSLTITALLVLACLLAASAARAQDIEPRQYANTPVGVNFLICGYAYTQGGLSFDPRCRSPSPA